MIKKIKDKLIGKRIVLKKNTPTILLANAMFKVVNENRKHLRPWFPWEKLTLKPEDSLKYLFETEEKFKAGKKVDYGIYINNKYAGSVGIFDINKENKTAEIGYWLSDKFIKKGYTTEAVKIMEKEFFTNGNLNRIQIRCDEKNIASSGVAKKCGYIFEGKHREDSYNNYFKGFRSTLVFSKLKSDYRKEKNKKIKQ